MLSSISAADALSRIDEFDTVIDARSETEFAADRLPGALNWPSLTDAQRFEIGTEYKQRSPFDAKKRGAAMVARNIAAHIERDVLQQPKDWKPLVYCWRGGKRSGALALVLDQIGFSVYLLEGGYRAYRRALIAALDEFPRRFEYRVVCGTTGSGKSRLLRVLRDLGAQVLDLEALANHRGSVLGLVPGQPQPGQKQFESRLWDALRRFDAARPVWIESESKKVGDLRVPDALVQRMRASPCFVLELELPARVVLLCDEYLHFVQDPVAFCERLDALRALRGREVVQRWQEWAHGGRTADVVRELLTTHYDPIYLQSMQRNFEDFSKPRISVAWDGSAESLKAAAKRLLASA
jgi:tRNA 2-selenouridine synthase